MLMLVFFNTAMQVITAENTVYCQSEINTDGDIDHYPIVCWLLLVQSAVTMTLGCKLARLRLRECGGGDYRER